MTISVVGQKGREDVVDKYGLKHMVGIGSKGGEHSHAGRSNEIETDNDNSKRGLVSSMRKPKKKYLKKVENHLKINTSDTTCNILIISNSTELILLI